MLKVLLLFLFSVNSYAVTLSCKVTRNFASIYSGSVDTIPGTNLEFFSESYLGFSVKEISEEVFEIEVLNRAEVFRAYAKGSLRLNKDEIKYSLWNEDALLEVSCTK